MRDLTGQKFGRWEVLYQDNDRVEKNRIYWMCRCSCGKIKSVLSTNLTQGYSKSCGCMQSKGMRNPSYKHGGTKSRLYNVWCNMRRRCYEKSNNRYTNYGGREIKVCEDWKDFAKFREWALSTGYDENAEYGKCTIERLDVDGDYEPGNCTWRTIQEQNFNRTSNRRVTHNGITLTVTEWDDLMNYRRGTIGNRLLRGWDIDRAIEQQPRRVSHGNSYANSGVH